MILSRTALSLAIFCGFVCQAQAQSYLEPKAPRHAYEDVLRMELDFVYGRYNTQIRLDGPPAAGTTTPTPGTVVSGEDDLGLPGSQFLGQVELTLFPAQHHMVRFDALSMRRSGSQNLTRAVDWKDAHYNVGDRVDSSLNLSLLGLTYGYLPFRTDRYELGLSFGLQIGTISANAEVLATNGPRPAESGAGPFPQFGIDGRFDFTKRWSVDARWQYLSTGWFGSLVDLQGVKATINDGRLALRWRQNQHLLYGLGYRYFNIDVVAPKSDPAGAARINFAGPMLFLQASM